MMTLSVLMSVYGTETGKNLDRALRSVWDDQTLKPSQIVLVEDGPIPAELEEIVESYKSKVSGSKFQVLAPLRSASEQSSNKSEGDCTFTIVKLQENVGLTKALNAGLKQVKGELIARMDSDDISEPHRFERQVKYLEEHPEVDIISGSLQEFDAENECLNVRHYPLTHEEAVKYIVKASPFAHPAVMMRRRIFDEGLKYDERYRMSQDIKLWFDALQAGCRFGNIPEVVLYFRREGDVYRRRSRAKAWNEFQIYMHGIYQMKGLFTTAYRFPIARYLFRNLPPVVVKWIYGSSVRNRVLKTK